MEQDNYFQQGDSETHRSRVNARAAKIRKEGISGIWIVGVLFVVFEALNLCFGWFPHHWAICVTFAAFAMLIGVTWWISGLLLNKMTHATTPRQHYRAARCFVLWRQLTQALSYAMAFMFASSIFDGFEYPRSLMPPLAILGLWVLLWCFNHDVLIDSDFCDAVEELKEKL